MGTHKIPGYIVKLMRDKNDTQRIDPVVTQGRTHPYRDCSSDKKGVPNMKNPPPPPPKSLKILDTSNMLPGTPIRKAAKAARLLNYAFFRFNGDVYDLEFNKVENLK